MANDDNYEDSLWFVVECQEDDSLILLRESKVIYGETVNVGDKVKFFHHGNEYCGDVKGFKRSYDEMFGLQKKLLKDKKAKKIKEESFHDERPRKSALKAAQNYAALIPRTRVKKSDNNSSNQAKYESSKKSLVDESKAEKLCDKEEGLSDDSSSASDSPLTPEQLKKLLKLDKKRRAMDNNVLSQVMKSPVQLRNQGFQEGFTLADDHSNVDTSEDEEQPVSADSRSKEETSRSKDKTSGSKEETSRSKEETSGSKEETSGRKEETSKSKEETSGSKEETPGSKEETSGSKEETSGSKEETSTQNGAKRKCDDDQAQKKRRRRGKVNKDKKIYEGKMYNYDENHIRVEELGKGRGVYIDSFALARIKKNTKTVTAYARQLLGEVFTREARLACSVGGNKASGRGASTKTLPALDPKGVAAIVDCSQDRGQRKKWSSPPDSTVRWAMNCKLCEDRANERCNDPADENKSANKVMLAEQPPKDPSAAETPSSESANKVMLAEQPPKDPSSAETPSSAERQTEEQPVEPNK